MQMVRLEGSGPSISKGDLQPSDRRGWQGNVIGAGSWGGRERNWRGNAMKALMKRLLMDVLPGQVGNKMEPAPDRAELRI